MAAYFCYRHFPSETTSLRWCQTLEWLTTTRLDRVVVSWRLSACWSLPPNHHSIESWAPISLPIWPGYPNVHHTDWNRLRRRSLASRSYPCTNQQAWAHWRNYQSSGALNHSGPRKDWSYSPRSSSCWLYGSYCCEVASFATPPPHPSRSWRFPNLSRHQVSASRVDYGWVFQSEPIPCYSGPEGPKYSLATWCWSCFYLLHCHDRGTSSTILSCHGWRQKSFQYLAEQLLTAWSTWWQDKPALK